MLVVSTPLMICSFGEPVINLFLKESGRVIYIRRGVQQRFIGNVSMKVDYSYGDFGRLNNVQKFSIGITF